MSTNFRMNIFVINDNFFKIRFGKINILISSIRIIYQQFFFITEIIICYRRWFIFFYSLTKIFISNCSTFKTRRYFFITIRRFFSFASFSFVSFFAFFSFFRFSSFLTFFFRLTLAFARTS